MPTELPNRDAFFACLNTRFRVMNVLPDPLELELISVSELMETTWQRAFSIVFLGPPDRMLPQHIYQLQHAQLGELNLFLVPVGKPERGFEYEAVFNHLKPVEKK